MNLTPGLLAAITKHDIAGIVVIVAAIAVFAWAGVRLAAKAAQASLLLVIGVVGVVVAVLLFTRVI